MSSKHKMVIITAPSGSGKTTIANYLLEQMPELTFSISATSRPMRDYEINGQHYYFYSNAEFKEMIEQDKFAEWEEVYPDKFYGTLKSEVQRAWKKDKVLVFDIDVNGARKLKKQYKENALTIFIKAPDIKTLEDRLNHRGSETSKTIKDRIDRAKYEYSLQDQFDVIIVNDDLKVAQNEALNIVQEYINHKEIETDA